jgi:cytosine/adenosine deaminase-related metal-dependent hydrolase
MASSTMARCSFAAIGLKPSAGDGSARAAGAIGNRLVAVPYVGAHPDYDYFDSIDDNERMLETWHGKAGGRINVWVGLEHLFYADEAGQRRAIDLARRYDTGFHTHSSENEIEVPEMQKRYGLRPMQVFERLGFFDVRKAMIAHAVWLDDAEIALLADRGVSVAHNPVSNMKLASGIARIDDLLKAGVAVGIGTDGEKENNNFDMFEEMKVASLLGKLRGLNAAALDSWDVLRMATITGARCLGLNSDIGSLAVAKKADLIAVRTLTPRMTPLFGGEYFNLHHNLVHAVRGSDVDLVMVDGKIVVDDGRLKTADMNQLIVDVRDLAPGLFTRRVSIDPSGAKALPGRPDLEDKVGGKLAYLTDHRRPGMLVGPILRAGSALLGAFIWEIAARPAAVSGLEISPLNASGNLFGSAVQPEKPRRVSPGCKHKNPFIPPQYGSKLIAQRAPIEIDAPADHARSRHYRKFAAANALVAGLGRDKAIEEVCAAPPPLRPRPRRARPPSIIEVFREVLAERWRVRSQRDTLSKHRVTYSHQRQSRSVHCTDPRWFCANQAARRANRT